MEIKPGQNLDKVVIEVTPKDVEEFLRYQHFKPTPEAVAGIMRELRVAYQEERDIGNIIDAVMWTSEEVTQNLERE